MNPGLSLLAAILQPFREAQVDRLDGLVMECINCGYVKTGGCGRMERFQKSGECVTEEGLFFLSPGCLSPHDLIGEVLIYVCFCSSGKKKKDLQRQIT